MSTWGDTGYSFCSVVIPSSFSFFNKFVLFAILVEVLKYKTKVDSGYPFLLM